MKVLDSKSISKINSSPRDPYRWEIYLAWLIMAMLFLAIALELTSWTAIIEGATTGITLATVGFYFHRFYRENQKNYQKEQRAKIRLINDISEQYPSLSPHKQILSQIVDEQLAAQSCSQKRLAVLSHYRQNRAAIKALACQLRGRYAQQRVLEDLNLEWSPKTVQLAPQKIKYRK